MRCVNSFPRDQEEPKKMREFPISSYSFPSPKSLSSFSPSLPFSSSFYSFPRVQCCGLQACLYFLFFLFLAVNTPGYTTSASLDPPPLQRSPFFRSKIPILNRLRIALLRRSSPFSSTSSSAGLSHSGGSSSFSSSPSVSVNQIRKPLHDHREYRYVELANGMKVLLIRDSRCDEASSSIRVGVGSASDPANIPGLAHFTEHMLFQGSKNYPGCHDFFDFVHEHGGLSNAFTSKFSTVFSFSIGPAFLNEALQRMADAFTNPLFKDTQFSKEVDAVHSEYTVDLTDDTHRVFHLVRQTSHGGPLSHFTVGNHESLLINTKRQGIDPLQAMKDFHSQWYSSNLMSLAILGRESLDELEAMARQHFSSVKNKNLQPPVFEECSDTFIPLDPKELGTQTFAVPLADIHDVHFVFYLPPQFREWRSKPLHWISSLLQSQGPSSLISRLRRLGLATALSAAYWSPELCTVFQIGVSLTEKGRSKESIYRIGELLFIYLRGMSSSRPERWRFAEMRHMMDLGFAYADMPRPFDLTVATVDGLYYYTPEEVLAGSHLVYDFAPEAIERYLHLYLTPDNLRLFVFDKKLGAQSQANREEHWYKIKHSVEEIPLSILHHWRVISKLGRKLSLRLMLSEGMDLPQPNPFLPNEALVLLDSQEKEQSQERSLQERGEKDNDVGDGNKDKNDLFFSNKAEREDERRMKREEEKKKKQKVMDKYPRILEFPAKHICRRSNGNEGDQSHAKEKEGKCNIFHKQDDTFHTPKGLVLLHMYYVEKLRDPVREQLLMSLYVTAINLSLRERYFAAHTGGISISLKHGVTLGHPGQPSVVRTKAIALQVAGFTDKLGYTLRSVARSISKETQEGEREEPPSDVKKKKKISSLSLSDRDSPSSSLPGHPHHPPPPPSQSGFLGFGMGSVSGPLSSVHTHVQPKKGLVTITDTTHIESSSIKLPNTDVEIGNTRIDRSHTNKVERHTADIDIYYQRAKLHGIGLGSSMKTSSSIFSPPFLSSIAPARQDDDEQSSQEQETQKTPVKNDKDEDAIKNNPLFSLSPSSSSSTLGEADHPLLEECFLQVALDSLRTGLRVATFSKAPSQQASSRTLEVLLHPYIPAQKLYEGLLKLEKDFIHEGDGSGLKRLLREVREWATKMWKKIYIEGLIQGNISRTSAEELISDVITELPIETVLSVSALDRINVLSISDLPSVDEDNKKTSLHTSCSSSSPCSSSSSSSSPLSSSSLIVEQASNGGQRNEAKKALEISPQHKFDLYSMGSASSDTLSPSQLPVLGEGENENEEAVLMKKHKKNRAQQTPGNMNSPWQAPSFSLSPASLARRLLLNPYDNGISEPSKSITINKKAKQDNEWRRRRRREREVSSRPDEQIKRIESDERKPPVASDQMGKGHMMIMYKRGGLRGGKGERETSSSSSFVSPHGNLFRRQFFNGKARLFLNYQSPPAVLTAHSNSMNLVSKTKTQEIPPSSSSIQSSFSSFPSILTAGDLELTPTHAAFSGHADRLKVTAMNRFSAGISRQVQSTQIQSIRSLHDSSKNSQINNGHLALQNLSEVHPSSSQGNLSDWRRVTANPIIRGRWARLIRKVLMKGRPLSRSQEESPSSSPRHPFQSFPPSASLPLSLSFSLPSSPPHEDSSALPRRLDNRTMTRRENLLLPPSTLQTFCPGCTPHRAPDVLRNPHIRAKLFNANPSDSKSQSYLLIEVGPLEKVHEKALLYLVYQWMSQRYFNELRTRQQLGYLTAMSIYRLEKIYYYVLRVTTTFNPSGVTERSLQFLREERSKTLTSDEFSKYQQAAIDIWKQQPKNIFEEFLKNLRQIVLADQTFDINERMVAELQQVTAEEVQAFRESTMFAKPWLVIELSSQRQKPKDLASEKSEEDSLDSGYIQPWRDIMPSLFSPSLNTEGQLLE